MNEILAHGDSEPVRSFGDYIGSPMYSVIPEHGLALAVVVIGLVVVWLSSTFGRGHLPWPKGIWRPYRQLSALERFVFSMVAIAGVVHISLVPTHELGVFTFAYLAGGVAELWVARSILLRRSWRRRAFWVLAGSLAAYSIVAMSGEPPDQLGLATKLVELAALAVVMIPVRTGRIRAMASTGVVLFAGFVVALSAWIGAFTGVEGGHHVGEAAEPGTLIPEGEDREPTDHEVAHADALYDATVAAVARYADPTVAAADGYDVDDIAGTDFHATNEAYKADGRIFDPERPENLIYAMGPSGPVLIGVMYEMEELGERGPAVGGPLTVWHAHDHVCFSLTPPALAGLTSPFGVCPLGSITMPMTNEMIHLWTLPGVPEKYGHLEDEWLSDYLQASAG